MNMKKPFCLELLSINVYAFLWNKVGSNEYLCFTSTQKLQFEWNFAPFLFTVQSEEHQVELVNVKWDT